MGIGNVGSTGRLGITPNTGVGSVASILGAKLLVDIDPSKSSRITSSGGLVSQLVDAKAGIVFSQAIGSFQPALVSGKIVGDGIDDELTATTGLAALPIAGGFEVWLVVNQINSAADSAYKTIFGWGDTAARAIWIRRNSVSSNNLLNVVIGNGSTAVQINSSGTAFNGKCLLRILVGTTTTTAYLNGENVGSTAVVPALTRDRARISANTVATAAQFSSIPLGRALITALLTDEEVSKITPLLNAIRDAM